MRMNKNKRINYFIASLGIVCALVFVFTIIGNFNSSFAIPVGVNNSGLPSGTFTTNVTNSNKVNYISNALTANSQTSSYSSLFDVQLMKTSDNKTPLYSLMKNLETPMTSEQFEILEDNPISVNDKGILYILTHGFNTTNVDNNIFATNQYGGVSDNNIKQYVTQIALWLYIYENNSKFSETYCANDACMFLNPSNNSAVSITDLRSLISKCGAFANYNYLNYITLLVDNAKKYTGREESKITAIDSGKLSYELNTGATELTTEVITPVVASNKDNYMYYSVEVSDPNGYGAYIADKDGNKITNANIMNGSFKIVVPLKEDVSEMDLTSIEVEVYGHFIKDLGYDYRVSKTSEDNSLINASKNQKYTNVLLGYSPYEVVSTKFNLYNFTKISKIDATNSKELPGATLVITKKGSDEKLETWISTTEPHYTYLEDGEYNLCETIAPDGYALNTECIEFSVDGSKVVSVEMKNEPAVKIPNTGSFKDNVLYFIGGLLILVGVCGIIVVSKSNKIN